jgi:hypothetical protein
LTFGISYNCSYDGWRFDTTLGTFDPYTFGNLSLELATDNNATDGCDGSDYLIRTSLVTTGLIHWVTHMWRTPTCNPSSFVATGSASGGGVNNDLWINVGQADLGDPGGLVWRASVSNLAGNSPASRRSVRGLSRGCDRYGGVVVVLVLAVVGTAVVVGVVAAGEVGCVRASTDSGTGRTRMYTTSVITKTSVTTSVERRKRRCFTAAAPHRRHP